MNRRRPSRAASVALTLLLGVGVLAGCAPADPAPDPTPTGFASEAEAFAAAEATYRAYVDALNQVDLADPATFEEVYRWTTGDANASARRNFSEYHADGVSVTGESEITLLEPLRVDGEKYQLAACLNVGRVQVVDASGQSLVSPDRSDTQTLTIYLAPLRTDTGLAVEDVGPRTGDPTC